MNIPIVKGIIDRRILINYRVDKEALEKYLPKPFRPKLIKGKGIVGICLIRLKELRPNGIPKQIGMSSENGAHRIAVEWTEKGELKEGVYIPRRDSSSKLNSLIGGNLFPGVHHLADFKVYESGDDYEVSFTSDDNTSLKIKARETKDLNADSVFESLDSVSDFFEKGSVGYSPNKKNYEGLELKAYTWKVSPLEVKEVESSFFENKKIFPEGSIVFDNALLMKNIEHEWHSLGKMEKESQD